MRLVANKFTIAIAIGKKFYKRYIQKCLNYEQAVLTSNFLLYIVHKYEYQYINYINMNINIYKSEIITIYNLNKLLYESQY